MISTVMFVYFKVLQPVLKRAIESKQSLISNIVETVMKIKYHV